MLDVYTVLLLWNVVSLRSLTNGLQTNSGTIFPQFDSLFDHAEHTSNMAALSSMMSRHLMHTEVQDICPRCQRLKSSPHVTHGHASVLEQIIDKADD